MEFSWVQEGHKACVTVTGLTQADPLPQLVALEKQLGEQDIQQMQLVFAEGLNPPKERLEKLGFETRAQAPDCYEKKVHYQRSVRFSVTEKCNYACFFCHEEGMEMGKKRAEADHQALFAAIQQFADLSFQDFTFTGGEPLLSRKKIFACLDFMESINYLPEITFVSNGLAITDALLERLTAYPGKVRFNISMHSLEEAAYSQIVQDIQKPDAPLNHGEHERVKQNLLKLKAAGIPFKLNVVLLKGLNTSDQSIQAILDYALSMGATRIKFLELLLTRELNHLYEYFYRLQALKDRLGDSISLVDRSFRRDVYRYADTDLMLEFQECTCARGCNTCPVNRAANFTAELKYFPCFLRPEEDFDLTQVPLNEALAASDQQIQQMADYYGDDSPIIIKNHYLTHSETFYYYQAASEVIERLKKDWALEEKLERRRDFVEEYFSRGSQATENFSQAYKLSRNTYDQHALEIEQSHSLCPQGTGKITTYFHNQGNKVLDPDGYAQQLLDQGERRLLSLNWTIHFYRVGGEIRGLNAGEELTLSYNNESGLYFLRSSQPLEATKLGLRPLQEPLPQFIRHRLRLV